MDGYWLLQHCWFSGRILACHAGDRGSIPRQCTGFSEIFKVNPMWNQQTLRVGFEPTREDPIWIQVKRLNHSAIAAEWRKMDKIQLLYVRSQSIDLWFNFSRWECVHGKKTIERKASPFKGSKTHLFPHFSPRGKYFCVFTHTHKEKKNQIRLPYHKYLYFTVAARKIKEADSIGIYPRRTTWRCE